VAKQMARMRGMTSRMRLPYCHLLRHRPLLLHRLPLIPEVQVAVATAQAVFLPRPNLIIPVIVTGAEMNIAVIGDVADVTATATIRLHRPVSVHHRRLDVEPIREVVAIIVEDTIENRNDRPLLDLLLLIVGITKKVDTVILQDHRHLPQ